MTDVQEMQQHTKTITDLTDMALKMKIRMKHISEGDRFATDLGFQIAVNGSSSRHDGASCNDIILYGQLLQLVEDRLLQVKLELKELLEC